MKRKLERTSIRAHVIVCSMTRKASLNNSSIVIGQFVRSLDQMSVSAAT